MNAQLARPASCLCCVELVLPGGLPVAITPQTAERLANELLCVARAVKFHAGSPVGRTVTTLNHR